jgi:hypothetical protein
MSGHGIAGFQQFTNVLQAPAIEGDFASTNPRHNVLAGQVYNLVGLQAGPAGVRVGYFGWVDSTGRLVNNFGGGAPTGIVHRCENALITQYLDGFSMIIPGGFMDGELFDGGDFWVRNTGANLATNGMKAYANNVTGAITFAATGAPTTAGTSTASTVSAQTASVTASITNNVMNVTAVGSGSLVPGGVLAGTGVAPGTVIVSQLSGTPLGVGTYQVSPQEQTVASTTITETYGLLTIGGTLTGTFAVGQTLTGGGGAVGTITGLGTGTGGAGTYYTQTQTVGSGIVNTVSNTETKWFARSTGAAGELVMVSSVAEN